MYTKVPKMVTFSALTLWTHVQMTSTKGIKPNDETVPMYSLPLYNFDQNISVKIQNVKVQMVNGCRMDGWMLILFLMILCFIP